MKKFGLTKQQIMNLFEASDPYTLGRLDVRDFVKSIRARYLETIVLKFVVHLFDFLDSPRMGKLTLLQVMHAFHAYNHPDIVSGKRTKGQIILGILPYFHDIDNISKDEFIEFNL